MRGGLGRGRAAAAAAGGAFLLRGHREYRPGDDPRRIDARVLARHDRVVVREYDAERDARTDVVRGRQREHSARSAAGRRRRAPRRSRSPSRSWTAGARASSWLRGGEPAVRARATTWATCEVLDGARRRGPRRRDRLRPRAPRARRRLAAARFARRPRLRPPLDRRTGAPRPRRHAGPRRSPGPPARPRGLRAPEPGAVVPLEAVDAETGARRLGRSASTARRRPASLPGRGPTRSAGLTTRARPASPTCRSHPTASPTSSCARSRARRRDVRGLAPAAHARRARVRDAAPPRPARDPAGALLAPPARARPVAVVLPSLLFLDDEPPGAGARRAGARGLRAPARALRRVGARARGVRTRLVSGSRAGRRVTVLIDDGPAMAAILRWDDGLEEARAVAEAVRARGGRRRRRSSIVTASGEGARARRVGAREAGAYVILVSDRRPEAPRRGGRLRRRRRRRGPRTRASWRSTSVTPTRRRVHATIWNDDREPRPPARRARRRRDRASGFPRSAPHAVGDLPSHRRRGPRPRRRSGCLHHGGALVADDLVVLDPPTLLVGFARRARPCRPPPPRGPPRRPRRGAARRLARVRGADGGGSSWALARSRSAGVAAMLEVGSASPMARRPSDPGATPGRRSSIRASGRHSNSTPPSGCTASRPRPLLARLPLRPRLSIVAASLLPRVAMRSGRGRALPPPGIPRSARPAPIDHRALAPLPRGRRDRPPRTRRPPAGACRRGVPSTRRLPARTRARASFPPVGPARARGGPEARPAPARPLRCWLALSGGGSGSARGLSAPPAGRPRAAVGIDAGAIPRQRHPRR